MVQCYEEAEHLRSVLHGLRHDHQGHDWKVPSMDSVHIYQYTDCRSLEAHLHQAGTGTTGDKRLAIDLGYLRQVLWRQRGEVNGDPLYGDHVPADATTHATWVETKTMVADCMTKKMKSEQMETLLQKGILAFDMNKENSKKAMAKERKMDKMEQNEANDVKMDAELHVPGAARVQPPGLVSGGGFGMDRVAAGLQSGRAPNSWLPSGLSAGVGVLPSRVGVGPTGVGGGVTPQVWSAGLQSAPDCLELLSRSELPDTPRCAKDQIKAGLLSASAPEFVPQPPALPALRPALGEITNMVHRQDDLKKGLAPVKPISRSPELQINTDAIFEDGSTDSNPSPPGLSCENQPDFTDLKVLGMLPSLGSLEHAAGTCKRCNFYPKGRCQNGQSCTFCHLSHDRRKASRSERKARLLADPATPSTDEEIFLGLPEVSPVSPLLPFPGQPVVPPPGLTSLLATQPVTPVWKDEDLELPIPSPLASTFMNPISLTSTGCLATVPMTNPVAPPSSPMTVLLQSHLEEDRKVMVTMATQTGEECDSECSIPRERLLQHRWSVSGPSSLGIRTEKISEETPGAV
eukprot:s182_g50.t1